MSLATEWIVMWGSYGQPGWYNGRNLLKHHQCFTETFIPITKVHAQADFLFLDSVLSFIICSFILCEDELEKRSLFHINWNMPLDKITPWLSESILCAYAKKVILFEQAGKCLYIYFFICVISFCPTIILLTLILWHCGPLFDKGLWDPAEWVVGL